MPCPRADAQLLLPVAAASVPPGAPSALELFANIPYYSANFSSAAAGGVTEDEVVDLEEGEESEADIFISSALAHAPEPVNLGGNGSLTLTRQDTGEKINAHYRNKDGSYDAEELAKINHIMRCSLTGNETMVAVKLVELLDAVEDHFGKKGLILLSGYRTPRLNRQVPGAAKNSLHMLGWAADIKIPGYSSTKVKKYGQKLHEGGIGYYPYKGFTHLDVGNPRYWAVSRPPRRHRPARKTQGRRTAAARGHAPASLSRASGLRKTAAKSTPAKTVSKQGTVKKRS